MQVISKLSTLVLALLFAMPIAAAQVGPVETVVEIVDGATPGDGFFVHFDFGQNRDFTGGDGTPVGGVMVYDSHGLTVTTTTWVTDDDGVYVLGEAGNTLTLHVDCSPDEDRTFEDYCDGPDDDGRKINPTTISSGDGVKVFHFTAEQLDGLLPGGAAAGFPATYVNMFSHPNSGPADAEASRFFADTNALAEAAVQTGDTSIIGTLDALVDSRTGFQPVLLVRTAAVNDAINCNFSYCDHNDGIIHAPKVLNSFTGPTGSTIVVPNRDGYFQFEQRALYDDSSPDTDLGLMTRDLGDGDFPHSYMSLGGAGVGEFGYLGFGQAIYANPDGNEIFRTVQEDGSILWEVPKHLVFDTLAGIQAGGVTTAGPAYLESGIFFKPRTADGVGDGGKYSAAHWNREGYDSSKVEDCQGIDTDRDNPRDETNGNNLCPYSKGYFHHAKVAQETLRTDNATDGGDGTGFLWDLLDLSFTAMYFVDPLVSDLTDGYAMHIHPHNGHILRGVQNVERPDGTTHRGYDHATWVPVDDNGYYSFRAYVDEVPAEYVSAGETGDDFFPRNTDKAAEWGDAGHASAFEIYHLESIANRDDPGMHRSNPLFTCTPDNGCIYDGGGNFRVPANALADVQGPVVAWAFIKMGVAQDGYQAASGFYSSLKNGFEGHAISDQMDYAFTPLVLENVAHWFVDAELDIPAGAEVALGDQFSFTLTLENTMPLSGIAIEDDAEGNAIPMFSGLIPTEEEGIIPPGSHEIEVMYGPDAAEQVGARTFTVTATSLAGEEIYSKTFDDQPVQVNPAPLEVEILNPPTALKFGEIFDLQVEISNPDAVLVGEDLEVTLTDSRGNSWDSVGSVSVPNEGTPAVATFEGLQFFSGPDGDDEQIVFTVDAAAAGFGDASDFANIGFSMPMLQITSVMAPSKQFYQENFDVSVVLGGSSVLAGDDVTITLNDGIEDHTKIVQIASTTTVVTFEDLNYDAAQVSSGFVTFTATASADNFLDAAEVTDETQLVPGEPIIDATGFTVSDAGNGDFTIDFDLFIDSQLGLPGDIDVSFTLNHLDDSPFGASPDDTNDSPDCGSLADISPFQLGTTQPVSMAPCQDGAGDALAGWYSLDITVSNGDGNVKGGGTTIFFKVVYDSGSSTGEITIEDAPSMLLDFFLDREPADYSVGDVLTATAAIRDGNGLQYFGTLQLDVLMDGNVVATKTCDDVVDLTDGNCDGFTEVVAINDARSEITLAVDFQLPDVLHDNALYSVLATIVNEDDDAQLDPVNEDKDGIATDPELSFTVANEAPVLSNGALSIDELTVAREKTVTAGFDLTDANWGAGWDVPVAAAEFGAITAEVVDAAGDVQSWNLAYSGVGTVSGTNTLTIDLAGIEDTDGGESFADAFAFTVPENTPAGVYRLVIDAQDNDDAPAESLELPFTVLPLPTVAVGELGEFSPGSDLVVDLSIATSDGSDLSEGMFNDVLVRVTQTDDADTPSTDFLTSGFENFASAGAVTIENGVGTASYTLSLPGHLDNDFTYGVEAIVVPAELTDRNGLTDVLVDCDAAFPDCQNVATEVFTVSAEAPTVERSGVDLDGVEWLGNADLVYVLPGEDGSTVDVTFDVDDLNWGSGTSLESTEIESVTVTAGDLAATLDDDTFGAHTAGGAESRIVTVNIPHLQEEGDYVVSVTVTDDNSETVTVDLTTIRVAPWFELAVNDNTDGLAGLSFTPAAPGDETSTADDPLRLSLTGSIGAELVFLEVTDFTSDDGRIAAGELTAYFLAQNGDSLLVDGDGNAIGKPVNQGAGDEFGTVVLSADELGLAELIASNTYIDVVFEFEVPDGTPAGSYSNTVTAEALQAAGPF